MFWGCFSAYGTRRLVRFEGIIKQDQYVKIRRENLEKSAEAPDMVSGMMFQHDNDPKHTAKSVKKLLRDDKINVLDWLSESPDLNPIKNLWVFFKKNVNFSNSIKFLGRFPHLLKNLIELEKNYKKEVG